MAGIREAHFKYEIRLKKFPKAEKSDRGLSCQTHPWPWISQLDTNSHVPLQYFISREKKRVIIKTKIRNSHCMLLVLFLSSSYHFVCFYVGTICHSTDFFLSTDSELSTFEPFFVYNSIIIFGFLLPFKLVIHTGKDSKVLDLLFPQHFSLMFWSWVTKEVIFFSNCLILWECWTQFVFCGRKTISLPIISFTVSLPSICRFEAKCYEIYVNTNLNNAPRTASLN